MLGSRRGLARAELRFDAQNVQRISRSGISAEQDANDQAEDDQLTAILGLDKVQRPRDQPGLGSNIKTGKELLIKAWVGQGFNLKVGRTAELGMRTLSWVKAMTMTKDKPVGKDSECS